MKTTRRQFLTLGGALGLALLPAGALAVGKGTAPAPLAGKRWALAVDLKKCQAANGCRDCMTACHTVHNVPSIPNPEEEVKWIWPEPFSAAFPGQGELQGELKEKPFPVMCNHCENPPCVRVCPTEATFQREDGVVQMDYHRCIGCRYCMAACPYGARSFNFRDPRPYVVQPNKAHPTREQGVVEKCNLCADRVAVGQVPTCVGVCKHGAILFGNMEEPGSDVRKALKVTYAIRRKAELGTEPKVWYLT